MKLIVYSSIRPAFQTLMILSLIIAGFYAKASAPERGVIRIFPNNLVVGQVVRLGEIARFEKMADSLKRRLKQISVGPINSKTFSFNRSRMTQALFPHLSVLPRSQRPVLVIPEKIFIKNSSDNLPQYLKERMKRGLEVHCKNCRAQISELQLPTQKLKKTEFWSLEEIPELVRGHHRFPIYRTSTTGQRVSENSVWVKAQVKLFQKAPVAVRSLRLNEVLRKGDFKFIEKEVTFLRDEIPGKNELLGRRLRLGVNPGGLIHWGKIQKKMALRRGELVMATIEEGQWTVSVSLIAEQDASIGDRIRLRNPKSNSSHFGEVVSQGKVRIQ